MQKTRFIFCILLIIELCLLYKFVEEQTSSYNGYSFNYTSQLCETRLSHRRDFTKIIVSNIKQYCIHFITALSLPPTSPYSASYLTSSNFTSNLNCLQLNITQALNFCTSPPKNRSYWRSQKINNINPLYFIYLSSNLPKPIDNRKTVPPILPARPSDPIFFFFFFFFTCWSEFGSMLNSPVAPHCPRECTRAHPLYQQCTSTRGNGASAAARGPLIILLNRPRTYCKARVCARVRDTGKRGERWGVSSGTPLWMVA